MMMHALFQAWLLFFVNAMERLKRKYNLVIDNCAIDWLNEKLDDVVVTIVPPKSTYLIQPSGRANYDTFKDILHKRSHKKYCRLLRL